MDKKSADIWRNTYIRGGMGALLGHGFKGNRSRGIASFHEMLGVKLGGPANG